MNTHLPHKTISARKTILLLCIATCCFAAKANAQGSVDRTVNNVSGQVHQTQQTIETAQGTINAVKGTASTIGSFFKGKSKQQDNTANRPEHSAAATPPANNTAVSANMPNTVITINNVSYTMLVAFA